MDFDPKLNARLKGIHEKLHRLRSEGWKKHRHQFRVEAHRFLVGKRLTESTLSTFEQKHGIRLPRDYRAFLLLIGEGGAGPYYGLLPLKRWNDLAEKPDRYLALPSPLMPGIEYADGWEEALAVAEEPYRGILPIAEQGCGTYCGLVVSGEAHGRVVYIGDGPPYFVWDRSFIGWYERWLDELIEGVNVALFGYTRGGTEAELLDDWRIASTLRERVEILASLGRRWPITELFHPTLREAVEDPQPPIRATALYAMARATARSMTRADAVFDSIFVQRLADTDAMVRGAAVGAMSTRIEAFLPELNRALERETDARTLFAICHALDKVNGIRLTSLRPHITSADIGLRRYVAHFFGKTTGTEGIDGFERLLADDDIHVQISAREGFLKRGLDTSIRWLEGRIAAAPTDADRAVLQQAMRILVPDFRTFLIEHK
jgi:hypothetical protein